jgi:hypothetical protein
MCPGSHIVPVALHLTKQIEARQLFGALISCNAMIASSASPIIRNRKHKWSMHEVISIVGQFIYCSQKPIHVFTVALQPLFALLSIGINVFWKVTRSCTS